MTRDYPPLVRLGHPEVFGQYGAALLMPRWKADRFWSMWCRAHRPWKAAHARRYRR